MAEVHTHAQTQSRQSHTQAGRRTAGRQADGQVGSRTGGQEDRRSIVGKPYSTSTELVCKIYCSPPNLNATTERVPLAVAKSGCTGSYVHSYTLGSLITGSARCSFHSYLGAP